jgi:hypothetical protein
LIFADTFNQAKDTEDTGWDFVRVCVDHNSRAAYVEVVPGLRKATALVFLDRVDKWFTGFGHPHSSTANRQWFPLSGQVVSMTRPRTGIF